MANGRDFGHRLGSGFLIGSAMVIPGVSGAVLAMVLGLYEPIISAVAKPFDNWRANLKLLVPLVLGAGSSLLFLSRVLQYLFAQHPLLTLYFFFGLIVASIPSMLRMANSNGFRLSYVLSLVLGVVTILVVTRLPGQFGHVPSFTPTFLGSALRGALMGIGLVIPGLSASLLLIAFGFYQGLLNAVADMDWNILFPVCAGLVPTILLMSKGIKQLFAWRSGHIYHAILGLMLGSLWVAFPGWPRTGLEFVLCLSLFSGGIWIALLFTKKQV